MSYRGASWVGHWAEDDAIPLFGSWVTSGVVLGQSCTLLLISQAQVALGPHFPLLISGEAKGEYDDRFH